MRTIITIPGINGKLGRNVQDKQFEYIEMEKTVIDGREIYIMKNEVRGNHEEETIS